MLGDLTAATDIYLVCGYTDMRKSIDGLRAIVEGAFHLDSRNHSLFLFCGRRCDRIKALLWEGDAKIATPAPSARDLSTTLPAF